MKKPLFCAALCLVLLAPTLSLAGGDGWRGHSAHGYYGQARGYDRGHGGHGGHGGQGGQGGLARIQLSEGRSPEERKAIALRVIALFPKNDFGSQGPGRHGWKQN